jgi:hypothetical protein
MRSYYVYRTDMPRHVTGKIVRSSRPSTAAGYYAKQFGSLGMINRMKKVAPAHWEIMGTSGVTFTVHVTPVGELQFMAEDCDETCEGDNQP